MRLFALNNLAELSGRSPSTVICRPEISKLKGTPVCGVVKSCPLAEFPTASLYGQDYDSVTGHGYQVAPGSRSGPASPLRGLAGRYLSDRRTASGDQVPSFIGRSTSSVIETRSGCWNT